MRRAGPADQGVRDHPSRGPSEETTDDDVERQTQRPGSPKPPELLPPWHTPEREELQLQARRFAMDEVLPVANELDPQKGEIPASLLDRLAELGYFGITVPAEHGGLGLGVFEYCMVSEELARAWMSTASILARSQGLGTAVADDERRAELMARSARGEWIGAIALSEPDAGLRPGRGLHPRRPRGRRVGGHRAQALVRQRQGRRLHPGAGARARPGAGGVAVERAWSTCCWRRSAASSPRGCPAIRSTRSATTASSPGTSRSTASASRPATSSTRPRPPGGQRRGGRGRQAGGLRRGAEVPQHRPRAHRRPRGRPGPRRAGGLDPLPAGARAVRPPDRRLPGAAVRRRRDGRADRAVARLLPPGGPPARPRRRRARRRRRWSSSRPPRCRCG